MKKVSTTQLIWGKKRARILGKIVKATQSSNPVLVSPITARSSLSIPLENIRKPKGLGFLIFSGDINKQQRAVIG